MKTKKLLAIILALVMILSCMTVTAFAQETKQLTVNDGTNTNLNVPYRANYIDSSGMRSQFLLDYADVEAMWGNKITKMTFYVQSGKSVDATFEVRLKMVDDTYVKGGFIDTTDATVVYSGTFSIVNGKIEIPFTNNFYYNEQSGATHNLLVDISMTTTAAYNGITYFYGVVIENTKTYRMYNNSNKGNESFSPKVTFDYEVDTYLDLESTDTYPEKKDIAQNYTFTQASEEYTDVTKVKLEWTISDIAATYKSHKTWDPDTLAWVEAKEDVSVTDQTATFKLTNYSSTNVQANLTFTVEDSLKDTYDADNSIFDNNDCLVMTPVVKDASKTYSENDFAAKAKTITATLKFSADAFKAISAQKTVAKYGTYTVTISEAKPNYLTFTANTAGSTVTPQFASGTYQYSTDNGATWLDGSNSGTTITLANVGDSVMLKGINCVTSENYYFSMTGSISASGSVTSLTDGLGSDKDVTLSDKCYYYMFFGCSALTTAPELPAITLTELCYYDMFYKTSITVAPALPATTLAKSCYECMFEKCYYLTTAPELPATDLEEACYNNMFSYCSALTTAPVISATNLAYKSCRNMFGDCTALTTAPTLLASDLSEMCYKWMFDGCTSLKITTEKPVSGTEGTDWGVIFSGAKTVGTDAVTSMFNRCVLGSGVDATPTVAEGTTYYWYK